MRFILIMALLSTLLCAGTASAQEAWRRGPSTVAQRVAGNEFPECDYGSTPRIGQGEVCYWTFNNSTSLSPVINIDTEYATVCYDNDIAADPGTTVDLDLRLIISDECSGATADANTSVSVYNGFNTTLNGTTGATGNLACWFEVPNGCYFLAPGAAVAQDSMVSVRGNIKP